VSQVIFQNNVMDVKNVLLVHKEYLLKLNHVHVVKKEQQVKQVQQNVYVVLKILKQIKNHAQQNV